MQTTIVELITTARVLVPISHNGTTPAELTEIAKQEYAEAIDELPFEVDIESLERGRITNADGPDALTVVQNILEEYHTIKPGMDWYTDNGHPVSDGEVMLKAIGNVVRQLGYVMMCHDAELSHSHTPDRLLYEILYWVARLNYESTIIDAIADAVSATHTIITAEQYHEQLERERTLQEA